MGIFSMPDTRFTLETQHGVEETRERLLAGTQPPRWWDYGWRKTSDKRIRLKMKGDKFLLFRHSLSNSRNPRYLFGELAPYGNGTRITGHYGFPTWLKWMQLFLIVVVVCGLLFAGAAGFSQNQDLQILLIIGGGLLFVAFVVYLSLAYIRATLPDEMEHTVAYLRRNLDAGYTEEDAAVRQVAEHHDRGTARGRRRLLRIVIPLIIVALYFGVAGAGEVFSEAPPPCRPLPPEAGWFTSGIGAVFLAILWLVGSRSPLNRGERLVAALPFLLLLVLGLLTVLGVDWQCWPVLRYMIRGGSEAD